MLEYLPANPAADEASIGSTLTVDRAEKKNVQSPQGSGKSSRCVSFVMECNIVYDTEPIFEDDLDDRWFGKCDYKQMKENFIDVGRHFQNLNCSDSQSFKTVVCKAFNACLEATEDPRSCLLERTDEESLRRCLNQDNRIGMERASVLSIFCDKSSRRKKLRKAIFRAQADTSEKDPVKHAERIREVSREITRPSRLFAWRLAYKQAS